MDELLKFAIDNGMLDLSYIKDKIEMAKREETLQNHTFKIWEGANGKWYTYLPDEERGRVQKARKSRKEIEDVVIEYWKEKLYNPTLEEVFTEWNDRRLELKKISNSTHLRNDLMFKRFYGEFGEERIKSISPDAVADFLEEQIPKYDLTAKAFSNLKSISKGFLKRAKKRKLIEWNVEELFQELDVSDADFKKVIKEDYQEVFDEQETDTFMEYLERNADSKNLGILLMFITGLRVGELVSLRNTDIEGNVVHIRRTETRYKDGSGNVVVSVSDFPKTAAGIRDVVVPKTYDWVLQRIRELNPQGEYVFLKKNGERLDTVGIRNRQYRLCRKLGIYKKSPHKIRKTYGTILLDNNIDKRFILGQMGHTNILCTENHYHRNRRGIDEKSEMLGDIPEFSECRF